MVAGAKVSNPLCIEIVNVNIRHSSEVSITLLRILFYLLGLFLLVLGNLAPRFLRFLFSLVFYSVGGQLRMGDQHLAIMRPTESGHVECLLLFVLSFPSSSFHAC